MVPARAQSSSACRAPVDRTMSPSTCYPAKDCGSRAAGVRVVREARHRTSPPRWSAVNCVLTAWGRSEPTPSSGPPVTPLRHTSAMDERRKRCGKCLATKSLEQFSYRDRGHTRPQSYCRTCLAEYHRAYYVRNREKAIRRAHDRRVRRISKNQSAARAYKDVPCTDCGGRFPPHVMDFDHILGDKTENISKMVYTAEPGALRKEIEKCEIVCANCHRERTMQRLKETRPHLRSSGRDGGNRTRDLLPPKQARYQAALRPVEGAAPKSTDRPSSGTHRALQLVLFDA